MSETDAAVRGGQRLTSLPSTVLDAALALSRERKGDRILVHLVDAALSVTRSRYAALAIYDGQGRIVTFLHRGMCDDDVRRVGRPPRGHGLLGAVAVAEEPVRLDDLTADPRFGGFPPSHPDMHSFIGVPVRSTVRRYGNLYAADKHGTGRFDEHDERALVMLAAFAAAALDGAQLVAAEQERGVAMAAAAAAAERERSRRDTLWLIMAAQEEERARVARDLHDEIGQSLTSVLLALHLVDTASRAEPVETTHVHARVADVRALVAEALRQVRRLAFDLRPTVLDDLGLAAALERLCSEFRSRQGLQVVLDTGDLHGQPRLTSLAETTAYRVVQESLTNAVRHAHATRVEVEIHLWPRSGERLPDPSLVGRRGAEATPDDPRLLVRIRDDGVGFDVSACRGSLGMRGMAERARLADGRLEVTSQVGSGTTVALELPLGRRA